MILPKSSSCIENQEHHPVAKDSVSGKTIDKYTQKENPFGTIGFCISTDYEPSSIYSRYTTKPLK